MAILLAFTMTSCSDTPQEVFPSNSAALFFALLLILVIFVRFVNLKIKSPRRLVGKTICLLREDKDDETWFFNDSSHMLVTNKDGITKEYVYRMLRDGKLLIEHYRNNDVVLIDAQNIWKSIIKGETRKEVLISNAPAILASSLYANRGEITEGEYVVNAFLADDSRRFFNKVTLEWFLYSVANLILFIFFIFTHEDSLETMSEVIFGQKIPEPSVSMFVLASSLVMGIYWLVIGFGQTYIDHNEKEIKKRATEEYYSMLREKGKYTSEAQLEYLKFEKMIREAEYVEKEKSRKNFYQFRWVLGVLMYLFVALLISWLSSWLAEMIDTAWGWALAAMVLVNVPIVISIFSVVIVEYRIEERARKKWCDKWGVEYERKEQELKEKISNSKTAENEQQ